MSKTLIIAEAGVNHNGSIRLAKKLIDIAIEARCDAIKFQTFKTENVISRFAPKADYQKGTTDSQETQYEMIKKLELSFEQFSELNNYCKKKNIMFLSTPFDFESIDFLLSLGISIFKIPSGEITNLPYLRKIGKLKKKIILSTGMATINEIQQALFVLEEEGAKEITILHCNTEYPTPFRNVNLRAINFLQDKFNYQVGYSDHTLGIEVAIAAVARGAKVIEKHFTLDKNMKGPDHQSSLEPNELISMVKAIRNIEIALGSEIKKPSESEKKNITIARKSIVAACNIKNGEMFTEKNITCKRPGDGISPMRWDEILGSRAKRNYKKDELI